MKKILISLCLLFLAASTSWGLSYSAFETGPWYSSGSDTLLGYGEFSPTNEANELIFANDVLTALGMGTTELLYGTGMKIDFPSSTDYKQLLSYDPGFAWEYAVVKVDGPNDFHYLYQDTYASGGDDLLETFAQGTTPFNMNNYGISHITWFGPAPVPEPSTLILLGVGLAGLAAYRRKKH